MKKVEKFILSEPAYKTVKKEDFSMRALYDLLENS